MLLSGTTSDMISMSFLWNSSRTTWCGAVLDTFSPYALNNISRRMGPLFLATFVRSSRMHKIKAWRRNRRRRSRIIGSRWPVDLSSREVSTLFVLFFLPVGRFLIQSQHLDDVRPSNVPPFNGVVPGSTSQGPRGDRSCYRFQTFANLGRYGRSSVRRCTHS